MTISGIFGIQSDRTRNHMQTRVPREPIIHTNLSQNEKKTRLDNHTVSSHKIICLLLSDLVRTDKNRSLRNLTSNRSVRFLKGFAVHKILL